MNTKEAQNELEIMLQQSLAARLCELGAAADAVEAALTPLDFNDIRGHYSRSNDDLKAAFEHLFV